MLSNTTSWLESTGGGYQKSIYVLDANGNKTEETIEYSPYYSTVKKFTYNDKGQIAEEIFSETFSYKYTYEYDSQNRVTKQIVTSGDWSFYFTYTYNSNGEIATKSYYAADGTLYSTYNYTYDSNGRLQKQGVDIESWQTTGYVLFYY